MQMHKWSGWALVNKWVDGQLALKQLAIIMLGLMGILVISQLWNRVIEHKCQSNFVWANYCSTTSAQ